MDAKSISEKRSNLQPLNNQPSSSTSSRHYQRSGRTESSQSEVSIFLFNGETPSVFKDNLMKLGEVDSTQANKKWNNYLNAYQKHLKQKELEAERKTDQKFQNEVKNKLHEQLALEEAAKMGKMEAYRAAVNDQSDAFYQRKKAEGQQKKMDEMRLKKEIETEAQLFYKKRANRESNKKHLYRKGLQQQKQLAKQRKNEEIQLAQELEHRNRNYLIDDSWKRKHEVDLKNHLKTALKTQIHEKEEKQVWDKEMGKVEQEQYRDDLQRAVDSDLIKRKQIEGAKKAIFKNEIEIQKLELQNQRAIEAGLKNEEDSRVNQKLLNDHLKYIDIKKRKNEILKDHNSKVAGQIIEAVQKKKKEALKKKEVHQTGLVTKGDKVKYMDYKDSENMMKIFRKRRKNKKAKAKVEH